MTVYLQETQNIKYGPVKRINENGNNVTARRRLDTSPKTLHGVPRHATPRVINNRQKIPRIVYAVPMNLRIGANVPVLSTKYRRVRHHSYLALETMQTEHYCHLFRVNFIAAMVILRHDVMNLDVNFYHGFFNTLLDFF